MISASTVKLLREQTGCGMMECKKALTETNGDMEKAIEFLRERGLAQAAKKSGRIAAEGIVDSYICDQCDAGVLIEVNAETDFVAKNDEFRTFVSDVAKIVAEKDPADVDTLLDCVYNEGKSVKDVLTEKISTIGENMNIRRFERYTGVNEAYIHGGGRIGVLINFKLGDDTKVTDPDFIEYKRNVALQIAALNPQYVCSEDMSEAQIAKEKEILTAQAINEGKPANIAEKMVEGRLKKYFQEICLLSQSYVKDDSMTVGKYTESVGSKIGTDIAIAKFVRFEKGEGLEKREDNFADEVAGMMNK